MRKLVEWAQLDEVDCVAACMTSIYLTVRAQEPTQGQSAYNRRRSVSEEYRCRSASEAYRRGMSIVHCAWSYFGLDVRALSPADEPKQPRAGFMYILFTSNSLGALHAVVLDARERDEKDWVIFDPAGEEWEWHPRDMEDFNMEPSGKKKLNWYIPVLQVKGEL